MGTILTCFVIGTGILNLGDKVRRHFGLHHPSSFVFAHKTIHRPKSLKSPLQREAFAQVGKILSNPMTDDLLLRFRDAHLLSGAEGAIPLRVWREVLDFYYQQGVIEYRYVLVLSTDPEEVRYERPYWDQWGQRLPKIPRSGYEALGELAPMKEAEMREMIGTLFPKWPLDSRSAKKPEFITLTERHFLKVYYRPLEWVSSS